MDPPLLSRLLAWLSSFHRPPLHANRAQGGQTCHNQRYLECLGQSAIVNLEGSVIILRIRNVLSQFSGSRRNHLVCIHPGDLGQTAGEAIGEYVLACRNHQCSTEELEKQDRRGSGGYVGDGEYCLGSDDGLLEAAPNPDTKNDLVSDPISCGRVHRKGGQQASTNRHHDGRNVDKRHVVSDDGRNETRHETGKDLSQDKRDIIYAGLRWGSTMNRLEPQREVVDQDEECTTKAEGKQGPKGNGSICQKPKGYCIKN